MPIYFFCTFDFKTIAWIFCLSLLEISVLHESFASSVFSFIVSSRQPSIQLFGKLHRKLYYDHTFGPERGSIKPNLFQNQNNVIQTSIFFLMKRIFLFSAYHFQSWSLASFYEHRVSLLAKKRRRLEPNAIQPL